MKTYITLITAVLMSMSGFAQSDSISTVNMHSESGSVTEATIDSIVAISDSTAGEFQTVEEGVQIADNDSVIAQLDSLEATEESKKDTIHIRVGRHAVEIITDEDNTHIDVERIGEFESRWEKKEQEKYDRQHYGSHKKFDGHWNGIDFGGNQLLNTSYALYPEGTSKFLETSPEKSFEVNLNLFEYSFGFCSYFGLVTGLGINFNDYKFKNKTTIIKDENGMIQPQDLPEGDFRVSKLSTVFITAPLLLEFQIPGQWDHDRMFITAGLIGGVKISEHTKTQIGEEKLKDKGDHNLSPVRWGYTARIGFENLGIFATYYNTKLFEKGKGPETTPLTVGLAFTF